MNATTEALLKLALATVADDDAHTTGHLPNNPWAVGQKYFIRTVTHHYTGRLAVVHPHELVLSEAAWVADSGRWAYALKTGTLSEVEPFPDGPVIISRGVIVDAARWDHDLPRAQK
jgi:hypothetical protein